MTLIQSKNTEVALSRKERFTLSAILGLTGALTTLDVYEDWVDGAPLAHIIPEVFIIFLTAGVAVYLLKAMLKKRKHIIVSAREDTLRARETAKNWQSKAESLSKGITDAISEQFIEWHLSPAEQEVGFLLLKGLSIQEVSAVRETSERTIRQQASQIYKKSGLSGRAQLSAFFMEDLFAR